MNQRSQTLRETHISQNFAGVEIFKWIIKLIGQQHNYVTFTIQIT